MAKFHILFAFIFVVFPLIVRAQDSHLEVSLGFREERVAKQLLAGDVQRIQAAEPMLDVRWTKKLDAHWQLTSGLALQMHTNRTWIENGINFNEQLNFHLLPVALFGVNRHVFSTKRLDLLVGVNQQFLLILNRNDVIGSKEGLFKTETVRKFRTINPISQISSQLNYKFKNNKKYLFIQYGYNVGWFHALERDVQYDFNSRTGRAIITTRGTGLQSRIGVGFSL